MHWMENQYRGKYTNKGESNNGISFNTVSDKKKQKKS